MEHFISAVQPKYKEDIPPKCTIMTWRQHINQGGSICRTHGTSHALHVQPTSRVTSPSLALFPFLCPHFAVCFFCSAGDSNVENGAM